MTRKNSVSRLNITSLNGKKIKKIATNLTFEFYIIFNYLLDDT